MVNDIQMIELIIVMYAKKNFILLLAIYKCSQSYGIYGI